MDEGGEDRDVIPEELEKIEECGIREMEGEGQHMAGIDVVYYQIVPCLTEPVHQWIAGAACTYTLVSAICAKGRG